MVDSVPCSGHDTERHQLSAPAFCSLPAITVIRERVMAGLSRAKADGIQLGRRRLEDTNTEKVTVMFAARARGTGIRRLG
jgi:hypothetical protein